MIFCDMDNVIVNFDKNFKDVYRINPAEISRIELWAKVIATKNYWYNLPMQADAKKLIEYLKRAEFHILTGIPSLDFRRAQKEKKQWVKKHIGQNINVICCLSKDKQKYCNPGDILIDDLEDNINRWEKAGGIGILHKSAEKTIETLKDKGF